MDVGPDKPLVTAMPPQVRLRLRLRHCVLLVLYSAVLIGGYPIRIR